MKKAVAFSFAFLFAGTTSVMAQKAAVKQTPKEYIAKWAPTAQRQMAKHGVPASITLAQGILESGSGNSELARKANNHFGIKCHGWEGKTFHQNDDKPNECFRAYKSAESSFEDHSLFLVGRSRYAFLFDLKQTDYKGWAKGLKKAGYATSSTYSSKLIDLIERYDLDQYDKNLPAVLPESPDVLATTGEPAPSSGAAVNPLLTHKVEYFEGRVAYVKARKGDTFYRIAMEFDMGLWQLYKYNDLGKRDVLKEGEVIYLQPKFNRGARNKGDHYECKGGESLVSLSQRFAIKLKKLTKFNPNLEPNSKLSQGEVVRLRP